MQAADSSFSCRARQVVLNEIGAEAGGGETLKWTGRAKRDLQQIIRLMERYKAVEIRWQTDMGQTKFALEIQVEKMKEQIRALKSSRRTGGGGGGGGYGGGGGG